MGWENVKNYRGIKKYVSTKHRHGGRPDECYYIYMKVNGKGKNEKVGWKSEGYTAKQASEIRAEKVKKVRHGIEDKKIITIGELWKHAYNYYLNNTKDPLTPYRYYHKHIKQIFGDKLAHEVSNKELEAFKEKLKSQNLKSGTRHSIFCVLKRIYQVGIEYGYYNGENPFNNWKPKEKGSDRRYRFLSYDEAEMLLNKLHDRSYEVYAMSLFSLHTGARLGEIKSLQWKNIDFKNNDVFLQNRKGGKEGHLFLTDKLSSVLKEKYERAESKYVFPGKNGGQRVARTPPRCFVNVAQELFPEDDKLNRVTFHTLRHTFASWLVMQGTPLYYVSKLLGHSSIQMTERYAHLAPDMAKSEVERMFNNQEEEKPKGRVVNFG